MSTKEQAETPWAFEIARLFPPQGRWDHQDYFDLTDRTRHLVELVDGKVEVLEMPTETHQLIVQFLFLAFYSHVAPASLGTLVFAPIRVETIPGRFREPDLAFMLAAHTDRRSNQYWHGADLVVEVVSEDEQSRVRDETVKRTEYAAAGISEYWIVDPRDKCISVLTLAGNQYVDDGIYGPGESAVSQLLPGLQIDVTKVWQATE